MVAGTTRNISSRVEAERRLRKAARKKAIFDGEIKAPPKKPRLDANGKPKPPARGRKF